VFTLSRSKNRRSAARTWRPVLEALEERTLLATVTPITTDPQLTGIVGITTDGVNLFVAAPVRPPGLGAVFTVPIGGGPATPLYTYAGGVDPPNPQSITLLGTSLYAIDPESGPASETQILTAPADGSGTPQAIYDGFSPLDGSGLTTDGTALYAADEVQGRVYRLNPDGSGLTQLGGSRYGGGFNTEHQNTLAASGGILYDADGGSAGVIDPQVVAIPSGGSSFTTLYAGAPFQHPSGIVVVGGTLYVADSAAQTIWALPVGGGTPTAVVTDSRFGALQNLTYFDNALYVTDESGAGGVHIWKITLAGNLTAAGEPVTTTEGVGFSGPVASFHDTDGDAAGSYQAAITWGDGHTSAGTVVPDDAGGFLVNGSNLYGEEGTFPVTVTITDGDGSTAQVATAATVGDFTPALTLGPDQSLRAGQAVTLSGSFADPSADTWTATVDYGDGSGPQPLPLNGDHSFALSHPYTAVGDQAVTVTVRDDEGVAGSSSFVVHVLPPVEVQSVVVNDGSAQRSMVDSITVTFSTQVDIAPGAFQLVQAVGGARTDLSRVVGVATQLTGDGRTVATLTFAGMGIVGGSLADGGYTLTIRADRIHDQQLGAPLDGNGDGLVGGARVDQFFRLFGDVNGDGQLTDTDRAAIRAALGSRKGMANYRWYLDYYGNGFVDASVGYQFLRRSRTRVSVAGSLTRME
jgi:hypothetical protein